MRYIKEIIKRNKGLILFYLFLGILTAFLTNFKAGFFQQVVDGLTNHTIALSGIILYGVILIVNYILNYLEEYPSKKLEQGTYLDFKLLALDKISRIDYLNYQSMGTGRLTQRIENGAEAGKSILFDFWFCLIRQLLPTICFSVFFIWKINHNVTYFILAGYVIIFLITNLLLKFLYQIKEKILTNEEKMNHYLVRGFMEMVVFRLSRQFPAEKKKAWNAKEEIVNSKVKMNMIHEAFFTIFALLVAILDIGILLYAWSSRSLSVGSVVALITLIDNAYTPIAIFNVLFVQYKLDQASFKRFETFLDSKEDTQLSSGETISSLSGAITIRDLNFSYGNRNLLDHVNLTIRPGEKVAFVGESGSGKSTICKLLLGLIKYEQGSICIDGHEVNALNLNSFYENVSYISQDSPIFDGTLRENLIFDQVMDDTKLLRVLEKVQLQTLFHQMEHGFDTPLGERGVTLSGGEKQRLALGRLWFHTSSLTILDEATSAMDNITEEEVMTEVMNLLEHKTVIAVAHRLNSIRNFDRILVFFQGQIVAEGTFHDLLEKNAYFNELYHSS